MFLKNDDKERREVIYQFRVQTIWELFWKRVQ